MQAITKAFLYLRIKNHVLGIIQYMRNKNAARELSEKRRHLACENKVDKSKNATQGLSGDVST